jgi:hypothetical protein
VKPYYEDSGMAIYHGDCREILPELDRVDLVLTDPPYAIGAGCGEWSATAAVAIGLSEAAKKVRSREGSMLVFTTTSGRGIEFTQGAIGRTLPFNRMLTWHKVGGRSRAISPWVWDSVAILLFGKAPPLKLGESSVWSTTSDYARETDHKAELPDGIASWLWSPFDAPAVTLDPFMGTGRLLEPAVKNSRQVIGIEIEERYCELAVKRLLVGASSEIASVR